MGSCCRPIQMQQSCRMWPERSSESRAQRGNSRVGEACTSESLLNFRGYRAPSLRSGFQNTYWKNPPMDCAPSEAPGISLTFNASRINRSVDWCCKPTFDLKPGRTCGPTSTVATCPPPSVKSVVWASSKVITSTLLPNFGLLIRGSMFACSQLSAAASLALSSQAGTPPGQSWASCCESGRRKTKLARFPAERSAENCEKETMFAICAEDCVTSLKKENGLCRFKYVPTEGPV